MLGKMDEEPIAMIADEMYIIVMDNLSAIARKIAPAKVIANSVATIVLTLTLKAIIIESSIVTNSTASLKLERMAASDLERCRSQKTANVGKKEVRLVDSEA